MPILGDSVSVADLAAYSTFWVLHTQGGDEAVARLPSEGLRAWALRVAALGHGTPAEMSAEEALRIARETRPEMPLATGDHDPSGLKAGSIVTVRADDNGPRLGARPTCGCRCTGDRDTIGTRQCR